MRPNQGKRRPALGTVTCPGCGGTFNVRGYGRHKMSCRSPSPTPTPTIDVEDRANSEPREGALTTHPATNGPDFDIQITDDQFPATETAEIAEDLNEVNAEGSGGSIDGVGRSGKCKSESAQRIRSPRGCLTTPGTQIPKAGDIVIEYHPHSKRGTRIISAEEYKASLSYISEPTEPVDDKPWHPFKSREDFEFAELVHDAALNRPQIERFIKLIRRCQDTPGSLTFQKYSDLKDSLESASELLTPVTIT